MYCAVAFGDVVACMCLTRPKSKARSLEQQELAERWLGWLGCV